MQYSRENAYAKFLRTPTLKNICVWLLLNWLYGVIVWNFVSGSHLKPSWLSNITKYQSYTLSCEPRFCMFIINGYYIKSKPLQSLDALLKDAIVYYCVLFVLVITTAQLHSTGPELRFCAGSNPACGVSACRTFAMVRISDNGLSWK